MRPALAPSLTPAATPLAASHGRAWLLQQRRQLRQAMVLARSTSMTMPEQPSNAEGTCSQSLPSDAIDRQSHTIAAVARRSTLLALAAGSMLRCTEMPAEAAPRIAPFCGVTPVIPPFAFSAQWEEGTLPYANYSTWYRALGKPPARAKKARSLKGGAAGPPLQPVLFLHGGPGLPSRYLESFELLGQGERRLVFYDQVGCGQSRIASRGKGPAFDAFGVQLFMDEVDVVRQTLQLEKVHLVAHGWGGMLALSYLHSKCQQQPGAGSGGNGDTSLQPPAGVLSLTLLATPPSYATLIADRVACAQALGPGTWAELEAGDREQQLQQAAPPESVRAAFARYSSAHITRGPGTSGGSSTSTAELAGCYQVARSTSSPSVRAAMTGGRYFEAAGQLAGWDARPWLGIVGARVPSLVLHGAQEELSLGSARALTEGLGPKARLVEVEGAGTLVHVDACERVLREVEGHLKAYDI